MMTYITYTEKIKFFYKLHDDIYNLHRKNKIFYNLHDDIYSLLLCPR